MLIASLKSLGGKLVITRSKKFTGFRMPNGSSSEMSRVLWVSNSEYFPELRRGDTVSKSCSCRDEIISWLQAAVMQTRRITSVPVIIASATILDPESLQAIQAHLVGLADAEMAMKGRQTK